MNTIYTYFDILKITSNIMYNHNIPIFLGIGMCTRAYFDIYNIQNMLLHYKILHCTKWMIFGTIISPFIISIIDSIIIYSILSYYYLYITCPFNLPWNKILRTFFPLN